MRACDEAPPGQLLRAIRQFNTRQWFECHETLEELWVTETGEVRDFFQGFLQISVALHHWRNGNYSGSVNLLASGITYLKRVSADCLWVDVSAIITDAGKMQAALENLGAEQMKLLDVAFIPLVKTVSDLRS